MKLGTRRNLIILLEVLLLVAFFWCLRGPLYPFVMASKLMELVNDTQDLNAVIPQSIRNEEETRNIYHRNNKRQVDMAAAFLSDRPLTTEQLRDQRVDLGAGGIYIVDRHRRVLLSNGAVAPDFADSSFTSLFEGEDITHLIPATAGSEGRYCYASSIAYVPAESMDAGDDDSEAQETPAKSETCHLMVTFPMSVVDGMVYGTSDWEYELTRMSVMTSGFAMAVSKEGTILAFPSQNSSRRDAEDQGIVGKNAWELGLSEQELVESVQDNSIFRCTLRGKEYYSLGVSTETLYLLSMVPVQEIDTYFLKVAGIIWLLVFLPIAFLVFYTFQVYRDLIRAKERGEAVEESRAGEERDLIGRNRDYPKKLVVFGLVSAFFASLLSLYLQQIVTSSEIMTSCNKRAGDAASLVADYGERVKVLKEWNDNVNLKICSTIAEMVKSDQSIMTREELGKLANLTGVKYINVFNAKGRLRATNSPYEDMVVREGANETLSAFLPLLSSPGQLILESREDPYTKEELQYIGVAMLDEAGRSLGFVQTVVSVRNLNNLVRKLNITGELDQVGVTDTGYAFAIDDEEEVIRLSGYDGLLDMRAGELDGAREIITTRRNGYLTIEGVRCFAAIETCPGYYVFNVFEESSIYDYQSPVMLTLIMLLFLLLGLLMLWVLGIGGCGKILAAHERRIEMPQGGYPGDAPQFSIMGRMAETWEEQGNSLTELLVKSDKPFFDERWDVNVMPWRYRSPQEKLKTVLGGFLFVVPAVISVLWFSGGRVLGNDSSILYIMRGVWDRGLNLFSVTSCVMMMSVMFTAVKIGSYLLYQVARISNARGETMCHLFKSFIKYAAVLFGVYYSLTRLGVDAATLLASAGVLSLIIGMGARDLVTDIIAGLFMIFENAIQVGDFIEIDGWAGMVSEIGIRTTRVEAYGQTKVVNNSNIREIVNISNRGSRILIYVDVPYEENISRLEEIFEKEVPAIRSSLPDAVSDPFYLGVEDFGASAMRLSFGVYCVGYQRMMTSRLFRRELKKLFDRHGISFAYPHMVYEQA